MFHKKQVVNGVLTSPGPDGIPCKFWNEIGDLVYHSFICAFSKGELSPSQRKDVINLVQKRHGLDRPQIMAPIIILNRDYKISKVTLTEIINLNQSLLSSFACGFENHLMKTCVNHCNQDPIKSWLLILTNIYKNFVPAISLKL